jgi:hypothetical protein
LPLCNTLPPIMAELQFHPPHHRCRPQGRQVRVAPLERPARPGRAAESRRWRHGENPHPLPAGAQRLPALRPRQVDLPELRPGRDYGGACHLRFDDTNPEKEEQEYVDSIIDAVQWLGFDWGDNQYFASDYFEWMYDFAENLIEAGHAYVDSQSAEEMRASRGTLTERARIQPAPRPQRPRTSTCSAA